MGLSQALDQMSEGQVTGDLLTETSGDLWIALQVECCCAGLPGQQRVV
jgi:hypothetical protein